MGVDRFPADALDRLSARLVSGKVVFFVGAGFSLDSEKNSSHRLIARLVARFLSLCWLLRQPDRIRLRPGAPRTPEAVAGIAAELVERFQGTFELDGRSERPAELATWDNVDRLARQYYNINDWMTSALTEIVTHLADLAPGVDVAEAIGPLEAHLLRLMGDDPRLIGAMELAHLRKLPPEHRGKALFLETLGFDNGAAMGGSPEHGDLDTVERSYRGLMRPRYRVLGRLAREGLSPILITTNYDLLVEGGYRLEGFALEGQERAEGLRYLPDSDFQRYSRIAAAEDFFERGGEQRLAQIVKIHGCALRYRNARRETIEAAERALAQKRRRSDDDPEAIDPDSPWVAALNKIVFTYREIQNWRTDSWAQDLLRTHIRARTVVFCGYSGMDPVIHDTFRTVYEEMAGQRRAEPADAKGDAPTRGATAPAFYLGVGAKKEFHGFELLRAASLAVGVHTPSLTDHANQVPFVLPKHPYAFPTIDDLFLWTYHRTVRRLQHAAIHAHLRSLLTRLLGHPPLDAELDTFEERFAALTVEESRVASTWQASDGPDGGSDVRRAFNQVVSWSDRFHANLLREHALAGAHQRHRGPGLDTAAIRELPWYCPASDHPDWSAWSAVLEVALRRRAARWRGAPDEWTALTGWGWLGPIPDRQATLLVSKGIDEPTPHALTIYLPGYEPALPTACATQHVATHVVWVLRPDEAPWVREDHGATPAASTLWRWACGPARPGPGEEAACGSFLDLFSSRRPVGAALP